MQDLYLEQKPISESDAEQMLKVLAKFLDELEGQTSALRHFQDDIRRSVAFIRSATRSISDVC